MTDAVSFTRNWMENNLHDFQEYPKTIFVKAIEIMSRYGSNDITKDKCEKLLQKLEKDLQRARFHDIEGFYKKIDKYWIDLALSRTTVH